MNHLIERRSTITEDIKTENTETAESDNSSSDVRSTDIKKKSFWSENKIEIIVAILLGITAILTAWASWIGSLHSGIQAINFTKSNNLKSEGNAEYNAGLQLYLSDIMTWNTIMDYTFELALAETDGNQTKVDLIDQKLQTYGDQNASDILMEGIEWMYENDEESPFDMPDITDKYFVSANEKLDEAERQLTEGQKDNTKGDAYNLVSVIYSLVLFLLGIVGVFKKLPNRVAVLVIAAVGLVLATIYMCTIPLPTGFNITNFIGL